MSTLTIRRVPIADLVPDPANARTHGDENLDAIEASLRRFGQVEPLLVQAGTGRIIAGHGRLAAMKRLGWPEADVVELDVTSLDATALGIALNRTAELAGWDDEVLSSAHKGGPRPPPRAARRNPDCGRLETAATALGSAKP